MTRCQIGLLQLLERRHQNFGNVAAAVRAEMTLRSGIGAGAGGWSIMGSERRFYELSHLFVVLYARGFFQARAGVHAPGLGFFDGADERWRHPGRRR